MFTKKKTATVTSIDSALSALRNGSNVEWQRNALLYLKESAAIYVRNRGTKSSDIVISDDVLLALIELGITSDDTHVREKSFHLIGEIYRNYGYSVKFEESVKSCIITELTTLENADSLHGAMSILLTLNKYEVVSFFLSKDIQSLVTSASALGVAEDIRRIAVEGFGYLLTTVWEHIITGEDSHFSTNGHYYGVINEYCYHHDNADDARKQTVDLIDYIQEFYKSIASEVMNNNSNAKININGQHLQDASSYVVDVMYTVISEIFCRYYRVFDTMRDSIDCLQGHVYTNNGSSDLNKLLFKYRRKNTGFNCYTHLMNPLFSILCIDPYLLISRWQQIPHSYDGSDTCEGLVTNMVKVLLLEMPKGSSINTQLSINKISSVFGLTSAGTAYDDTSESRFSGGTGTCCINVIQYAIDWLTKCLVHKLSSPILTTALKAIGDVIDIISYDALASSRLEVSPVILQNGIRILDTYHLLSCSSSSSSTSSRRIGSSNQPVPLVSDKVDLLCKLIIAMRFIPQSYYKMFYSSICRHVLLLSDAVVQVRLIAEMSMLLLIIPTKEGVIAPPDVLQRVCLDPFIKQQLVFNGNTNGVSSSSSISGSNTFSMFQLIFVSSLCHAACNLLSLCVLAATAYAQLQHTSETSGPSAVPAAIIGIGRWASVAGNTRDSLGSTIEMFKHVNQLSIRNILGNITTMIALFARSIECKDTAEQLIPLSYIRMVDVSASVLLDNSLYSLLSNASVIDTGSAGSSSSERGIDKDKRAFVDALRGLIDAIASDGRNVSVFVLLQLINVIAPHLKSIYAYDGSALPSVAMRLLAIIRQELSNGLRSGSSSSSSSSKSMRASAFGYIDSSISSGISSSTYMSEVQLSMIEKAVRVALDVVVASHSSTICEYALTILADVSAHARHLPPYLLEEIDSCRQRIRLGAAAIGVASADADVGTCSFDWLGDISTDGSATGLFSRRSSSSSSVGRSVSSSTSIDGNTGICAADYIAVIDDVLYSHIMTTPGYVTDSSSTGSSTNSSSSSGRSVPVGRLDDDAVGDQTNVMVVDPVARGIASVLGAHVYKDIITAKAMSSYVDVYWEQISGSSDLLTVYASTSIDRLTMQLTIAVKVVNTSCCKVPIFKMQLLLNPASVRDSSGEYIGQSASIAKGLSCCLGDEYMKPADVVVRCFTVDVHHFGLLDVLIRIVYPDIEVDRSKVCVLNRSPGRTPATTATTAPTVDDTAAATNDSSSVKGSTDVSIDCSPIRIGVSSLLLAYGKGVFSSSKTLLNVRLLGSLNITAGIPLTVSLCQWNRLTHQSDVMVESAAGDAGVVDSSSCLSLSGIVSKAVILTQVTNGTLGTYAFDMSGRVAIKCTSPATTDEQSHCTLAWALQSYWGDEMAVRLTAFSTVDASIDVDRVVWRGTMSMRFSSVYVQTQVLRDIPAFVNALTAGTVRATR